jgi:acid phosphatase
MMKEVSAHANLDSGYSATTTMKILRLVLPLAIIAGCATQPPANDPAKDLGLLWVKHAAEYQALTRQAYRSATNALPNLIADTSWSALPGQTAAADLPPAVILDVDETVVSNVDFQLEFERPFANHKLDTWTRSTNATPISGVLDFVDTARAQGVEVFFVTNRPCELIDGIDDPCPQKRSTIDDIAEVGIVTDADHVMLSEEQGWTREKSTRRDLIAETHRIIMLFGDDLGDFLPCVRSSPKLPCTNAATNASRDTAVKEHAEYWGRGWYILPNPMHGSWTSAQ